MLKGARWCVWSWISCVVTATRNIRTFHRTYALRSRAGPSSSIHSWTSTPARASRPVSALRLCSVSSSSSPSQLSVHCQLDMERPLELIIIILIINNLKKNNNNCYPMVCQSLAAWTEYRANLYIFILIYNLYLLFTESRIIIIIIITLFLAFVWPADFMRSLQVLVSQKRFRECWNGNFYRPDSRPDDQLSISEVLVVG